MSFLYIIVFSCTIFLSLFSSSKNAIHSSEYQNLNKQWTQMFQEYTNPKLGDKIVANPYNQSLSVAAQIYGFHAMKSGKILQNNAKELSERDKFRLQNGINYNISCAVLSQRLELRKTLDYISNCQKEIIHRAQIDTNSCHTTEESSITISDISSHSSNVDQSSSVTKAESFTSFLESRKKLERAQQLKKKSDCIYYKSQEAQDREKKALEIIAFDKQEQIHKNIFVGISRFQAHWKGYSLRKDLAGIQQRLIYEQEQKRNTIIEKDKVIQQQKEIEAYQAKNILEKQQVLVDNKKKKKQQRKIKLQKFEQQKINKEALQQKRAIEVEKEEIKRYSLLELKRFGTFMPDAMSEKDFQTKLINHVKQCIENFSLNDEVKRNIVTRTIYNSVANLSQEAFDNNLIESYRFNRKKVFATIIIPTCDQEMANFFKKTSWGQQLSDNEINYLIAIKKEAFFSALHWLYKNSVLKEK